MLILWVSSLMEASAMARTTPRPVPTETQTLQPLQRYCPTCGETMWAAYHNYRTITTLEAVLALTLQIRRCLNRGSCTCALRINPPGSPVDHHRGKKAYKRGLSWPPSVPLSPGEALDAGHTDTRRHLRLSSLAASHPPRLVHTCAGCGHGGTRNSSTSRSVQTWSVSPAAMAGV
jgi:hypothetical protein